jgi:hypothetical protein
VSLMTRSQAKKAQAQAQAQALMLLEAAQIRARQGATQLAPYAATAAAGARQGLYNARTWTAPRLRRTGVTLQEQVAPKMADMLSTAAQRVDPAPVPAPRRRRWPLLTTLGFLTAAGLAIAALLRSRGGLGSMLGGEGPSEASDAYPAATPEPDSEASSSDVDGRVTP